MTQYIGNKKIIKADRKDGKVEITFKTDKDNKLPKLELKEKLFDLIATEDLQNGNLNQIINDKISRKFFAELSEYGIPVSQVGAVAQSLVNLANNLSSFAIGKKFGYTHRDEITVEDILNLS